MLKRFFGGKSEGAKANEPKAAERPVLTQEDLEVISKIYTDAEFLQAHCRLMDRFN